jgi:hypothetical protein
MSTASRTRATAPALWNKVWNGYLGWEGLARPSERFVAGKMLLRFALLGLIPILLATLISIPLMSSAYAHTDPDYTRSTLIYGRPLLELVPSGTTVQLGDGSYVSATLLTQLRTLYGNYFPDLTAAVVSGDSTPLRDLLSSDLYNTYAAQITQAHTAGWTVSLWGGGQFPESLSFNSVSPASGPQQASAWSEPLTMVITDKNGAILSSTDYTTVNVSFGLTNVGWRITGLDLKPTPQ